MALSGVTIAAQENIDAHHSFAADDTDLDGAPIVHGVDHGNYSFFGEVHVLDFLIRPINDLIAFQYHVLELRQKALVFRGEEGCKDAVPDGNVGGRGTPPWMVRAAHCSHRQC